MCNFCEKQCYQVAFLNEMVQDPCRGLCWADEEECEHLIKIKDEKYCSCTNNPEKIDYKKDDV